MISFLCLQSPKDIIPSYFYSLWLYYVSSSLEYNRPPSPRAEGFTSLGLGQGWAQRVLLPFSPHQLCFGAHDLASLSLSFLVCKMVLTVEPVGGDVVRWTQDGESLPWGRGALTLHVAVESTRG